MFGSAAAEAVALKSKAPATWQAVQSLIGPGNSTSEKPAGVVACQVKGTVRARAPWMEWMKSLALAAQAELVRFGLWQNAQVGPSLRWPAWKDGVTPSGAWHAL